MQLQKISILHPPPFVQTHQANQNYFFNYQILLLLLSTFSALYVYTNEYSAINSDPSLSSYRSQEHNGHKAEHKTD